MPGRGQEVEFSWILLRAIIRRRALADDEMAEAALTIANLCNNAALRRAARRLGQLYDVELTPSGLRTTQHGLLTQIEVMGSPALGELAEIMVMDASALSHTLRPLTRDGLVSFVVDNCDRRRRRIVLTEAGKARLELSTKLWSEAQEHFERVFGVEKAAALRDVLVGLASPEFAEAYRKDSRPGEATRARATARGSDSRAR
jgi:DNA-binding MarR family transcriptional regulator